MYEQDKLDAALEELMSERRKESLWLVCLKEENGNAQMASARYVMERAKAMESNSPVMQDRLENKPARAEVKPEQPISIGTSFSAVGVVEDVTDEEILANSYPDKKESIYRNWRVTAFVAMLHIILGLMTIDILKGKNSVIISSIETFINGQVKYVQKRYSRYQDIGDDDFRDTKTGIVWLNRLMPERDALIFMRRNPGYRMPSLHELSSLVDCGKNANRMPLELVDGRYFRQTHLAHNGQCYGTVKSPPMPEHFGAFRSTLLSFDVHPDEPSKVWGVSAMDGGARLYERRKTMGHVALVRVY